MPFHRAIPYAASTLIAVAALSGAPTQQPAGASPAAIAKQSKAKKTEVGLRIATPGRVAATVVFRRGERSVVATKPSGVTRANVNVRLTRGRWRVLPQPATVEGKLFTSRSTTVNVTSQASRSRARSLKVRYRAATPIRGVGVIGASPRSLRLGWQGKAGNRVVVRRSTGVRVPSSPRAGRSVPVRGSRATDSGLKPGTRYSYAIFARKGQGWLQPVGITAMTVAKEDGNYSVYALRPGTQQVKPRRLAVDAATRQASVRWPDGLALPTIDSAIVLPPSNRLPRGFLGRVIKVARDGTSVLLAPTTLAHAFSLYVVDMPNISRSTAQSGRGTRYAECTGEGTLEFSGDTYTLDDGDGVEGGERDSSFFIGLAERRIQLGVGLEATLLEPGVRVHGRFAATVGSSAKMELAPGGVSCLASTTLPDIVIPTNTPVPLIVDPELAATAEITAFAETSLSDLSYTRAFGFDYVGEWLIQPGVVPTLISDPLDPPLAYNHFQDDPIQRAQPIGSRKGGLKADIKLGGTVEFGPGYSLGSWNAIVGLSGEVWPLRFRFAASWDEQRQMCITGTLGGEWGLGLGASLDSTPIDASVRIVGGEWGIRTQT